MVRPVDEETSTANGESDSGDRPILDRYQPEVDRSSSSQLDERPFSGDGGGNPLSPCTSPAYRRPHRSRSSILQAPIGPPTRGGRRRQPCSCSCAAHEPRNTGERLKIEAETTVGPALDSQTRSLPVRPDFHPYILYPPSYLSTFTETYSFKGQSGRNGCQGAV